MRILYWTLINHDHQIYHFLVKCQRFFFFYIIEDWSESGWSCMNKYYFLEIFQWLSIILNLWEDYWLPNPNFVHSEFSLIPGKYFLSIRFIVDLSYTLVKKVLIIIIFCFTFSLVIQDSKWFPSIYPIFKFWIYVKHQSLTKDCYVWHVSFLTKFLTSL